MNRFKRLLHWRELTLPGQFLLAGAVIMSLAMAIVGNWIGELIRQVRYNAASTGGGISQVPETVVSGSLPSKSCRKAKFALKILTYLDC
tara:strand:+ start:2939 stop:3205 length:267 start_codon:yes stop_codon:yes gene_type:complete